MAEPTTPPLDDESDTGQADVPTAVVALTDEDLQPAGRRKWLARLARAGVKERGVRTVFSLNAAKQWVISAVTEAAPHIPIRDLATLQRHFPGLERDALADRLVRNAARSTAGIGATGGGIAAVEWVATPTLLSAPVLLAAETVAVVAVEMKLIGELQEVYGRPVEGTQAQKATALLQAWANRRGINPLAPGRGLAAALNTAARKELRDRLLKRFGRNLTTLGPFLTGAAVAGFLNRRATLSLAEEIRKDLAKHQQKIIEG